MTRLIAYKDRDEGCGPPYEPVVRRTYLYDIGMPAARRRYFVTYGDLTLRTWLSDEDAQKWLENAVRVS